MHKQVYPLYISCSTGIPPRKKQAYLPFPFTADKLNFHFQDCKKVHSRYILLQLNHADIYDKFQPISSPVSLNASFLEITRKMISISSYEDEFTYPQKLTYLQ